MTKCVLILLLLAIAGCSSTHPPGGELSNSSPTTHSFEVKLVKAHTDPVRLDMKGPDPRVISIQSVDAKKAPSHRFDLRPGEYQLSVTAEGFEDFSLPIQIPDNDSISVALTPLPGGPDKKKAEEKKPKPKDKKIPVVSYEIVEKEDFSIKALGGKKPSTFSKAELDRLPTARRISCRVVVSPKIKKEEVQPTVEAIIEKVTKNDGDIDAITLFLYSDKKLIDGQWEVARAVWGPNGEWAGISSKVAGSNDRTSHSITLEIRPDLEKHLASKGQTKNGLSEAKRMEVYRALGLAEQRAMDEADAVYPITFDSGKETMRLNTEKMNELTEKYKTETRQKYKLSETEFEAIALEGLQKGWPLD